MPTITPAYGRDYKSAAAAEKDFLENKDFIFHEIGNRWDGKYCNKTDLIAGGYTQVTIRYNNLRKVTVCNF